MRITMVGRLSECYLLAYRTDPARARRLLPRGLEPSVHDGAAFWNVVVSKVDRMRPKGAPRVLGMSYVHVAYRLYAQARAATGGTVEGLFFVRSDVDRRLMALGGNVATDFRFHAADVDWRAEEGRVTVAVEGTKEGAGDAEVTLDLRPAPDAPRPPSHLKYAPLGLSTNAAGTKLRVAEVRRDEARWSEAPVRVVEARWGLFERLGERDAALVSATRVAPLDYVWRLGRTMPLAPAAP